MARYSRRRSTRRSYSGSRRVGRRSSSRRSGFAGRRGGRYSARRSGSARTVRIVIEQPSNQLGRVVPGMAPDGQMVTMNSQPRRARF